MLTAIRLTSFLASGVIQGSPGDIVDVTPDNQSACEKLLKEQGAIAIRITEPTKGLKPQRANNDNDHDDSDDDAGGNDDGGGLAEVDDTDGVDSLDIAPRYKQALRDAGVNTIAEVRAHADLASVAGLNKAVAAKILKSIE